jgi:hypothetical protein
VWSGAPFGRFNPDILDEVSVRHEVWDSFSRQVQNIEMFMSHVMWNFLTKSCITCNAELSHEAVKVDGV